MLIKYIFTLHYIYVCFQNNPGQVNIWGCISFSVNSNAHTTPVRIYGDPFAHKFCAVDIFGEYQSAVKQYHPLPSSITCLGVVSWLSGLYWFLSNVSQPIRINYFSWKYNIVKWNADHSCFLALRIPLSFSYSVYFCFKWSVLSLHNRNSWI